MRPCRATQATPETPTQPAPAARKATPPTQPGTLFKGLIDLSEKDPVSTRSWTGLLRPSRPKPGPPVRRIWSQAIEKASGFGQRGRWAAAGVILLGLVVACRGDIKVRTANGVIVLENVPEKAVVEVDGDRVTVDSHEGEPVKIEIPAGKHVVLVKRGNDVLLGESVILESGKDLKLPVKYEPTGSSRLESDSGIVSSSPIDRSRFTVREGQWHVEGNELFQTDVTRWYDALMFGDERWTDYDFTVDAMRTGGFEFLLVVPPEHRSGQ